MIRAESEIRDQSGPSGSELRAVRAATAGAGAGAGAQTSPKLTFNSR